MQFMKGSSFLSERIRRKDSPMMKQKNKSFWSLMGLPGFVWYAVLGLLSPVVSALFALSLQPIVDAGLSGDMARFGKACLLAVLLAAADLLFMYGVQYSRAVLVNRSTRLLSQAYFDYILRQQDTRCQDNACRYGDIHPA